jgi:hypothetical protein
MSQTLLDSAAGKIASDFNGHFALRFHLAIVRWESPAAIGSRSITKCGSQCPPTSLGCDSTFLSNCLGPSQFISALPQRNPSHLPLLSLQHFASYLTVVSIGCPTEQWGQTTSQWKQRTRSTTAKRSATLQRLRPRTRLYTTPRSWAAA